MPPHFIIHDSPYVHTAGEATGKFKYPIYIAYPPISKMNSH